MLHKFLQSHKDHFYLAFRILVGAMFALHGATKFGFIGGGEGVELFSQIGLAAVIELFAGLAILFGAYTEIAASASGLLMIAAFLKVHATNWNPLVSKGETALLYLAAFLVLATHGPGKLWVTNRK